MVASGGILTVSDPFTRCENHCLIHGPVAFLSRSSGEAAWGVKIILQYTLRDDNSFHTKYLRS